MSWIRELDGSSVMADLLNIEDLHLEFHTYDGVAKVLAGVDLQDAAGPMCWAWWAKQAAANL